MHFGKETAVTCTEGQKSKMEKIKLHVRSKNSMAYKEKERRGCHMYDEKLELHALALVGTLKHKPKRSNTEELTNLVAKHLKEYRVKTEIIRLVDCHIPAGVVGRINKKDEWPRIAEKMKNADILIFGTPIWWGNLSSEMQRIIERMDVLDEIYRQSGKSVLYNKVAGLVITGSEDGALAVTGRMMMVMHWLGFTIPPECTTYWVGEVGQDPKRDREKRIKNKATQTMAQRMARNLAYYAQLLHHHPLVEK